MLILLSIYVVHYIILVLIPEDYGYSIVIYNLIYKIGKNIQLFFYNKPLRWNFLLEENGRMVIKINNS